jgi:menaquinone-dependent protoporphyrinogen IX oxidase
MERRTFLKMGSAAIVMALSKKAWALKFYPKQSNKKWAVLYATWCGSSRDAGIWISEGMGGIAEVYDVREKPDLKGFDHIVLGSSIRGHKINPLLETYITENKNWLKKRIRGFWAICNNGGKPPGQQQKEMYIDNQLAKLSGVTNVPGKVFPGRVTKDLLKKEAFEKIKSFPDNDNLKRADCLVFGKKIFASVK